MPQEAGPPSYQDFPRETSFGNKVLGNRPRAGRHLCGRGGRGAAGPGRSFRPHLLHDRNHPLSILAGYGEFLVLPQPGIELP